MAGAFDSDRLIAQLAEAETTDARFAALAQGLGTIGIDIVNYGFFDLRVAELVDADIRFLTTMRDDWMDYYYDRGLSETDSHVLRVRAKKITPYSWGESVVQRIEHDRERATALESSEAGLVSGLYVPLTDPHDPFSPVAGIGLGSSMAEGEFQKILQEHGATLVSVAHLFHNASIRQIWREQTGSAALTERERDSLQYLAEGQRQDAIAHKLGVARVTVEKHLRSAREKLHARTLSETVAKALLFGEIRRS